VSASTLQARSPPTPPACQFALTDGDGQWRPRTRAPAAGSRSSLPRRVIPSRDLVLYLAPPLSGGGLVPSSFFLPRLARWRPVHQSTTQWEWRPPPTSAPSVHLLAPALLGSWVASSSRYPRPALINPPHPTAPLQFHARVRAGAGKR
jgi:hypothetical protein